MSESRRVAPPRGSGSPRPYPPLVRPSQKHSNHERMHGIIGTSARTTPSRESATQPWRSPFMIPFLIYPTSTPLGSHGGSNAAKFPPTITVIFRDHITSYLSQAIARAHRVQTRPRITYHVSPLDHFHVHIPIHTGQRTHAPMLKFHCSLQLSFASLKSRVVSLPFHEINGHRVRGRIR